ncbi:hypothetical protein TNCV_1737531 [Trichonephila clavipes]|nr:hypothetical protein TNCV_1737531 [Trichonephila clavipes]
MAIGDGPLNFEPESSEEDSAWAGTPPSPNSLSTPTCQVIYSQFGLAIHQNDHQARRRFVEWAQNEIAVVPDFHKRILFTDEAHFWLNGYVDKQTAHLSAPIISSRQSMVDKDQRSERPQTTRNAAVVERVDHLITKDPCLTVQETTEPAEVSKGSPDAILCGYAQTGSEIYFQASVRGTKRNPSCSCTGSTELYQR